MIRHLFISSAHNYRGHHGGPAGQHPTEEVSEIECVAGRGIRGDRYFDHQPDFKGQITFFSWEHLVQMWDELGMPHGDRDSSATRRNVIIQGLDLNALIGEEFEIQGVRFLGTEECRPCYWMNGAIHPGAEAWMKGRGGLRAKILTDGRLTQDACDGLCAVLMAGGKSSRMGRDKALIEIQGQPLWQRQLEALRSMAVRVAVAAPTPPAWMDKQTVFIADAEGASGPLAGILAALEWAISVGGTHLLVTACDMPRLSAAMLRRLRTSCSPGVGVVPRGSSGSEPLAAIYPAEALPVLRNHADDGNWKLQEAVEALEAAGLCLPFPLEESDAAQFLNLNTPVELRNMEKI